MSDDIFDLKRTDDLPDSIVGELSKRAAGNFDLQIVAIFERSIKGKMTFLTVDQITVAYYRLTGGEKTRKQIAIKLYNMVKRGILIPYKNIRGAYVLKNLKKDKTNEQ